MPVTALFRADAGLQIGAGHLMRSLALAQAWKDMGGRAVLLTAPAAPDAERFWTDEGFLVEHLAAVPGSAADVERTLGAAEVAAATWIVTDGYCFDASYLSALHARFRLLAIDDLAPLPYYHADLIVNHNIYADAKLYEGRAPRAELLTGARYALLRRQFRTLEDVPRDIPAIARKVLVTFGGSDSHNVSLLVLEALKRSTVSNLQVTVLLGAANPHAQSLEEAAHGATFQFDLRRNVRDMVGLLQQTEVAISAGGGTCAELAQLQVPTLLLTIADNHELTVEEYGRRGFAVAAGWFHQHQPETLARLIDRLLRDGDLRRQMTAAAGAIFDGQGAARIAHRMLEIGITERS